MVSLSFQFKTPVDAIIFDCDGTLSQIEGIDVLAEMNQCADVVKAMTHEAMTKTGLNPELYQKRLEIVRPALQQIIELGEQYFINRSPDICQVLNILTQLHKPIFVVSAGFTPAIAIFADKLSIPRTHIFAVGIEFTPEGKFLDYDHLSPLIDNQGKRKIVSQLKQQYHNVVYIGDGLNDCAVMDLVERFIGYGGAFYRENIAKRCQFYIKTQSMLPLLPLVLTQHEVDQLAEPEKNSFARGLTAIEQNEVFIQKN